MCDTQTLESLDDNHLRLKKNGKYKHIIMDGFRTFHVVGILPLVAKDFIWRVLLGISSKVL